MDHTEYRRIVPEADTAVLFIHGIAGTPRHFDPFLPLVPEGYSVVNLLLPGHGGTVLDFAGASMAAWEEQVRLAVQELAAEHGRIILVAHSMGTLFAIEQAVREPKVKGLFLLAVPLRLRIRPQLAVNSAKVFFNRIGAEDAVAQAARDCYGIARDRNLLHYLGWIPRYLELFRKIRDTGKLLPQLKTPGRVFQSGKDEMVSVKTVGVLNACESLSVSVLQDSTHYCYTPEDRRLMETQLRKFLTQ